MDTIIVGLLWYWAFLFSTVAHEAAHAWAGLLMGDPTAYHEGQVSLDPHPHIRREPMGTVLIPIVSYLMGGWMMGWANAPYDPYWAERYPRKAAWMALAGPAANLIIVLVTGLLFYAGLATGVFRMPESAGFSHVVDVTSTIGWLQGAATLLSIVFSLNIGLFAFNLIPLPPLDGSIAVTLLMNDEYAQRYRDIMLDPSMSIIGLMLAWKLGSPICRVLFRVAINCLYPGHF